MPEIVMPRLVEHMEEALVSRWLYDDGDEISKGEEIVEIETDKATTAIESEFEGTLRILAEEGATVAVGAPLAEVGASHAESPEPEIVSESSPAATFSSRAAESDAPAAPAGIPVVSAGAATSPSTAPPASSSNGSGRIVASPVARRMAREHGLDLASLAPERASRRILKDDVVRALREPPPAAEPPAAAPAAPAAGEAAGSATLQELSRTQQLIARRMTESASTIPDFAVAAEVDMSGCVELRSRLKAAAEADVVQPSYNDMIVKAVASALRAFPRANASYRDGRLEMHSRVNVGVAVAAEEALVVPTVFDADLASLGTIARRTRELSQRVRDGHIAPAELAGGTFTVSNLGMYGVSHFTAVINPPQAAILAVGAIEKRAVVRGDELCVRPMMTINLISDHRILYGAEAARFVAKVRALLEDPWAILL